jgi:hypothetical protein
MESCANLGNENEIRLQYLFLELIGFYLLVLASLSPKSLSLHPYDFGDSLCQFM